jgi:protein-disulfide isomerase
MLKNSHFGFVLLMKYLLLSLIMLSGCLAKAQNPVDTTPQFLKTKTVPSFKLLLMDSSTYFYKYQLKKNTPTIIVYFNPDCDHCQHDAKKIVDTIKAFKNAQFVFVSYAPFGEIKKFTITYKLNEQKNIKVGRDEKYFISVFFKVRFTPFVAVYDGLGNLVRVFEGGTTMKKLAELINANSAARSSTMLGFEPE